MGSSSLPSYERSLVHRNVEWGQIKRYLPPDSNDAPLLLDHNQPPDAVDEPEEIGEEIQ